MKRVLAHKTNSVVDDYMNSLLFDVGATNSDAAPENVSGTENAWSLAQVKKGFELAVLWQDPLTDSQKVCRLLMLLSLVRTLPESQLKTVIMNAIRPS